MPVAQQSLRAFEREAERGLAVVRLESVCTGGSSRWHIGKCYVAADDGLPDRPKL